ncbi:MAG: hypothetical protein B6I38_05260 [Anaerolineaceae bacterium 4572_5.1]|nr:MAG: hypothetical protein B6I38_05260 [Anaerolineaceae bacterium 4572_5.1]
MPQTPIYTIGYGAREIDDFLRTLKANDIHYLLDVRSRPYSSYKPEFSQESLKDFLEKNDIRYLFMGDALGGKLDGEENADFEKIAQKPAYQNGIKRLHKASSQGNRVALMCSKGKPEHSHCTHLIGKTLTEDGIKVLHIDEKDELLSQEDILLRLPPSVQRTSGRDTASHPPDGGRNAPAEDINPFAGTEAANLIPEKNFTTENLNIAKAKVLPPSVRWTSGRDTASHPPDKRRTTVPSPIEGRLGRGEGAIKKILQEKFGYPKFRALQEEIIQNVLKKQDSLAVMPTGSGKSLCYQLPATIFDGLTVVVSPLISLMEDQVLELQEWGIPALYLNSTLTYAEYGRAVGRVQKGEIKLLYGAPETLLRPETIALLENSHVESLVIDEAHCISEWGHDFRPEYRQLNTLRRRLPQATTLALTATATRRVRADIKKTLQITDANEFIGSFDRPNLNLSVSDKVAGMAQTRDFLNQHKKQAGIIYCSTRDNVDNLTEQLKSEGFPVLPYHAGMDDQTRRAHQRRFRYEDNLIIVATIAFGMGINKSNVRFIVHYDLPKNVENYYQQIGRAGRDGLPADCLLLFSYSDVRTIRYFISQNAPELRAGAETRLDALLAFVDALNCRRIPLLDYFGEKYGGGNCKACDNCLDKGQADRSGSELATVKENLTAPALLFVSIQFIRLGLLKRTKPHGSLVITDAGREVLKGKEVWGKIAGSFAKAAKQEKGKYDSVLFEKLRILRGKLASEKNVPPYVIFHDRTLVDMASYFPHTEADLRQIYGVGGRKVAEYGKRFLPVIQAYCRENDIKPLSKQKPRAKKRLSSKTGRQRSEYVWKQFQGGKSIQQIASDMGFRPGTIFRHLQKSHEDGREINVEYLKKSSKLSAKDGQRVIDAFAEHGDGFLSPIFNALNEEISYDEIKLWKMIFELEDSKLKGRG